MSMIAEHDDGPMALTAHDLQSNTWTKLRRHMESKLQSLRMKNDTDLDPEATAKVRGSIANLKNLLALGQPNQAMVADEDTGE